MAFVAPLIEGLGALGEGAGAAEAGAGAAEGASTAARGGGMLKDFNDSPVGKIMGKASTSIAGHEIAHTVEGAAHTASSAVGTGPSYEKVDIGSMGNLA